MHATIFETAATCEHSFKMCGLMFIMFSQLPVRIDGTWCCSSETGIFFDHFIDLCGNQWEAKNDWEFGSEGGGGGGGGEGKKGFSWELELRAEFGIAKKFPPSLESEWSFGFHFTFTALFGFLGLGLHWAFGGHRQSENEAFGYALGLFTLLYWVSVLTF